jgi:hypothetical protein
MSSRFKALFEVAKQEETPEAKPVKKSVQKKMEKPVSDPKQTKVKGKRSNPDYIGAFAYIPGKLHEDVKIHLLRRKDLDFSGLVEKLLTDWLDKQK